MTILLARGIDFETIFGTILRGGTVSFKNPPGTDE
jgi:hypothetical protein